jgi:hypothetical protein
MSTTVTTEKYNAVIPDVQGFVVPKNNLLKDIKVSKCVDLVVKEIQSIPNFSTYRIDPEVIKMVINIVENVYTEKKSGDTKKSIVVQAFVKVFNLTPQEQKILSDFIDFLSNNNKIKKISIIKKYVKPLLSWIKKKVV